MNGVKFVFTVLLVHYEEDVELPTSFEIATDSL